MCVCLRIQVYFLREEINNVFVRDFGAGWILKFSSNDQGLRPLVSMQVFMHVKVSSIHVWLSEGTHTLTDVWHMRVALLMDGLWLPFGSLGGTGAWALKSRPSGCCGKRRWLSPVGGLLASSVPFMYISFTVWTTDKWACSWWAPQDT